MSTPHNKAYNLDKVLKMRFGGGGWGGEGSGEEVEFLKWIQLIFFIVSVNNQIEIISACKKCENAKSAFNAAAEKVKSGNFIAVDCTQNEGILFLHWNASIRAISKFHSAHMWNLRRISYSEIYANTAWLNDPLLEPFRVNTTARSLSDIVVFAMVENDNDFGDI